MRIGLRILLGYFLIVALAPLLLNQAVGAAAGRIVGVLTVAKPNRVIAPFIERSQEIVLAWGSVLLGVALLVGFAAATWLSRQLGALRRYAQKVTAGERASLPQSAGEF